MPILRGGDFEIEIEHLKSFQIFAANLVCRHGRYVRSRSTLSSSHRTGLPFTSRAESLVVPPNHQTANKHWGEFGIFMNDKFENDTLLIAEAEKTETATDDANILIGRSNTSLEAAYLIGDRHSWNYLEFDYAEMAFELESMVPHIHQEAF
jgi:hypothetical protein